MSQYEGKSLVVTNGWRNIIRFAAFCGLLVTLYAASGEVRMGRLAKEIKTAGAHASFADFEELVAYPYFEYPLLSKVIPYYVQSTLRKQDVALAEKVLPYAQRLTDIQGAHWQWFYLSHVYFLLERNEEAMTAVTKAIDLWPTEQAYWGFQHYLNMHKAVDHTGRTLRDFWPVPPGKDVDAVMKDFDLYDQIKFYK